MSDLDPNKPIKKKGSNPYRGVYKGIASAAEDLASRISKGRSAGLQTEIAGVGHLLPATGEGMPIGPSAPAPAAAPAPTPTSAPKPAPAPTPTGPVSGPPGIWAASQFGALPDLTPLADKLNEPPDDPNDPEMSLAKKILEYMGNLHTNSGGVGGPMTFGESMALGLLAGLDPNALQNIVMPIIMHERDLPRQAALDQERVTQLQMSAMDSVARLYGSIAERKATMGFHAATLQQQGVEEAGRNRRAAAAEAGAMTRTEMNVKAREAARTAPKPIDPATKRQLANFETVERTAVEALQYLDDHPEVGRPFTGPLAMTSKIYSDFSAKLGKARTEILHAEFGSRVTEAERKNLLGTIVGLNAFEHQKRSSLESIRDWARSKKDAIHQEFDTPTAATTAGLQQGDIDLSDEFLLPGEE